jgi:hypothetical protein
VEDRFDLIVSGMSHGDEPSTEPFGCGTKKIVSRGSGSRFETVAHAVGYSRNVRTANFERHTQPLAHVRQPSFVSGRVGGAQAVIHVGDEQPASAASLRFHRNRGSQQGHAIGPARNGEQKVHISPFGYWPSGSESRLEV